MNNKTCGWCTKPSLQAICITCNAEIIICHNSIDCCWVHREGGIICDTLVLGMQAWPIPDSIEPSTTNDIPKPVNIKKHIALVLATSKRSGKRYAEMLGLKNYLVVTSQKQIEGLKTRAIVITPGYYEKIQGVQYQADYVMRVAMRMGMLSNAPLG